MIHDKHVDRAFAGFQPKPELFLDGGENGWAGRRVIQLRRAVEFGSPFQLNVVEARQAGLIENDFALKTGGQKRPKREFAVPHVAQIDVDEIALRRRRSLQCRDFERGLRIGGEAKRKDEKCFHCDSVKSTSTVVSTGAGLPLSKVG